MRLKVDVVRGEVKVVEPGGERGHEVDARGRGVVRVDLRRLW